MEQDEDLSVYVKKNFHKMQGMHFRNMLERDLFRDAKRGEIHENRKDRRAHLRIERRGVPAQMSPFETPGKAPIKGVQVKETREETAADDAAKKRYEKLLLWKAEREKAKQEAAKHKKPVFKVSRVVTEVKLENVYRQIKGKAFKSTFAPPNHKFRPPKNINPMTFVSSEPNGGKVEGKVTKNNLVEPRMITRAQARKCKADLEKNAQQKTAAPIKTASILGADHKQPDKNEREKKKSGQSKINKQESRQNVASKKNEKSDSTEGQFRRAESTQKQAKQEHNDQRSTATPKPNSTSATKLIGSNSSPVSDSVASCKTPKQREEPPVYISPFVTLTRGKNSARKAGTSKSGSTSLATPSATDHFTRIVDAQIVRLEEICMDWSNYKEQENPPEEAVSMIDCAIGQTNLLINKKFVQFRGLIEKCKMEVPTAERPVTCEDLHGFWDMVYIQVENIEKRFDNLTNLRKNNWEEVIPVPKKTSKKRGKSSKKATASTGLKAAILAARNKNKEIGSQDSEAVVDAGPESNRKSLLVKSAKARISSPGLVMLKVTQHLKILDTPTKGILKTNGSKSARKNILIIEPPEEMSKENIANNNNIPTPRRLSPKVNTPRRSARLSRAKLF